ncbi:MAG TPA: response regulator [Actinoplanes sp.]
MAYLLVVDDDVDMLDLVVHRLRPTGHEVRSAVSAAVALALVEQFGMPDAVILDVAMPGTGGFELLEQLRSRQPGLPALFLTVLWGADVVERVRAVNAGYAAKPFSVGQLHASVSVLLAKSGAGDVPGGQS